MLDNENNKCTIVVLVVFCYFSKTNLVPEVINFQYSLILIGNMFNLTHHSLQQQNKVLSPLRIYSVVLDPAKSLLSSVVNLQKLLTDLLLDHLNIPDASTQLLGSRSGCTSMHYIKAHILISYNYVMSSDSSK